MAEHNNHLAGRLPPKPHPLLQTLEPLVGTWRMSGPEVAGIITWEWMEGAFFLIQRFDLLQQRHQKGIEYTGYDEETGTLRSRSMQTNGSRFTYTYEIDGDTWLYWFGDKSSSGHARATFSKDRRTITGRWQWVATDGSPAGYDFVLKRLDKASK